MQADAIARVYGAALFENALEKGLLEEVHEGANYLLEAIDRDPALQGKLRPFVESPNVERGEKMRALERAFRGRLPDPLVNMMLLMVQKGRAFHVRGALGEMRRLRDKHVGVVPVEAATAVPLDQERLESLQRSMEEKLGRKVEIRNPVQPELLGGLVVRYDGKVADGSLRTALESIARKMSSIKFGSQIVHEN